MSFSQWVRSWYGSEIWAYYARDDIRPALHKVGYGIKLAKLMTALLSMKVDEDMVPGMEKALGNTGRVHEEAVEEAKPT